MIFLKREKTSKVKQYICLYAFLAEIQKEQRNTEGKLSNFLLAKYKKNVGNLDIK